MRTERRDGFDADAKRHHLLLGLIVFPARERVVEPRNGMRIPFLASGSIRQHGAGFFVSDLVFVGGVHRFQQVARLA